MSELAVCFYGDAPSFDRRQGPITARVEVPGGTDGFELDVERGRLRLATHPGPDPYRWLDARSLLSAARVPLWGLRLIEDRLPVPVAPPIPRRRRRPASPWRRPFLPRDACSCLACRATVVLSRSRRSGTWRLMTPSRRLLARIAGLVARCEGVDPAPTSRGPNATRGHGRDCFRLGLVFPKGKGGFDG